MKLATASINGYIVLPGGNFSFNNVVGERTKERGYQYAAIYSSSGIEKELGGGICQFRQLLRRDALRKPQAGVKKLPYVYGNLCRLRFDATVYWGSIDYVFKTTPLIRLK